MSRCLPLALVALAGLAVAADPPRLPDGPAPAVAVAPPVSHANLTVFLLRGKDTLPAGHKLLTLQEAMEQKKVVVHETSAVNELAVENVSADVDVFVQAGDIVRGGRQDRLMAADLVVPPKSGRVAIPSFCCEAGRWRQRGAENDKAFGKSDAQAGNRDLKLALNAARDQGQVWDEVKKAQMKLSQNVGKPVAARESPSSYQLTLEDKDLQAKLDAYVKPLLAAIDGKGDVIGLAVVINGKVQGADVYGSAELFRKLWPKLLRAAAVDALSEYAKDKKFDAVAVRDVETFLATAAAGKRADVDLASLGERGRGQQQAANRGPNPQPQAQQRAQADNRTAQAELRPSAATPGRVRIVQAISDKAVMVESQDGKIGNAVLHRSYIAK